MLISLNWLKKYIDLDDISTEDIIEKLTTSGLEVDGFEDKRKDFENIVVGYVEEKKKHPNADKLSLCRVSDGEKDFEVICGAPNVESGQKVAFAKIGAVIPNGQFKISKSKIRGIASEGMICSETELGIGDDSSGIIVLDNKCELGANLAEALEIDDVIIDIDLTPNRADATSHFGVARDLAAVYDRDAAFPGYSGKESGKSSGDFAEIVIENANSCPRYVGKVVTGVEIKESPAWLKKHLTAIGLRPINNVVDVTNFVLHEMGQPLHAFDLNELAGHKIVVKDAGNFKKFTTLDSKEREMSSDDLMICDGDKPVAIAGVMGGENSEVTEKTKNILIESAFFNPSSIRRTAKRLGLQTDASYRFERGCNPDFTILAARRAAELIAELAGGEIAVGEIDIYPNPIEPKNIELRFDRIKKILGYKVADAEVIRILNKLELKVISATEGSIMVSVPPFRHDIEREIDLIEEVARIYGYDRIPAVDRIFNNLQTKIDESQFVDKVKSVMTSLGFWEIITNSLLKKEVAEKFGNAISILNPQNADMSHMRTSLIPGMLGTISRNLRVKENNLMLFEIGHIFKKNSDRSIKGFDDISETEHLLCAITGEKMSKQWFNNKPDKFDAYDLKGFIDELLVNLSLDKTVKDSYNDIDNSFFEYSFSKLYGKITVGYGGKLNRAILDLFQIDQEVFIFDLNLSRLDSAEILPKKFKELLKYPKVYRDFAFIFDKQIKYKDVKKIILTDSSNLLKNVHLFDIFESESLGKDKKSLAFQLEYFDEKRTLTEEEVDKDFWQIIEKIKTKFKAELRGS